MQTYKIITIGLGIIILGVVVLFAAGVFGINGLSPDVTTTGTTVGTSETSATTTFNETTAATTMATTPAITSATTSATIATTVNPTPKPTAKPTAKPTPKPTTPTTAATTTATTAATTAEFTFNVTNDDGVAPAGYTIVFIDVTPAGSYTVRYDGQSTVDTGGGHYYIQTAKVNGGNYAAHVTVAK